MSRSESQQIHTIFRPEYQRITQYITTEKSIIITSVQLCLWSHVSISVTSVLICFSNQIEVIVMIHITNYSNTNTNYCVISKYFHSNWYWINTKTTKYGFTSCTIYVFPWSRTCINTLMWFDYIKLNNSFLSVFVWFWSDYHIECVYEVLGVFHPIPSKEVYNRHHCVTISKTVSQPEV